MVIGNHLTGMILRRGQVRLAGRCGASAKSRNTATAQKNPAYGACGRPDRIRRSLIRRSRNIDPPRQREPPRWSLPNIVIQVSCAIIGTPICEFGRPGQRRKRDNSRQYDDPLGDRCARFEGRPRTGRATCGREYGRRCDISARNGVVARECGSVPHRRHSLAQPPPRYSAINGALASGLATA